MYSKDIKSTFPGRVTLTAANSWGSLFPAAPGVYVVTIEKLIPRLFGDTDIVYIGQAGKHVSRGEAVVQATLRQRWTDYWAGTTSTERDFRDTLKKVSAGGSLVIVLHTTAPMTPPELLNEEARLIHQFFEDHRELPPLNRSKPSSPTN